MIIDDSRIARVLLRRALEGSGRNLSFIECEGAGEVFAKVEADPPDIVVCDWNMPEINGIELFRILRPRFPNLFCGFLTTNESAQERRLALELGADFYVSKPYRPDDVREILELWDESRTDAS